MMKQPTALLLGFTLSLSVMGCNNRSSAATGQASASQAAESAAATKVTKVVFVGVERACDCTRRRVEAGWDALQKALGRPAKLPVERLQIDTQREKVMPYRKQKPMMALPAIYFIDGKNVALELLQGEVSEAQITAALKK